MSSHNHNHPKGSVSDKVKEVIEATIPESVAEVAGAGGHYTIAVTSPAFAGKNTLERHRLVLSAITPLMSGDEAPVHAVDSLVTKTP